MDDAVAYRRRAWFGMILVAAFVLLGVAALLPGRTPPSLRIEQAGAAVAPSAPTSTPPAPASTVPGIAPAATTAPSTATTATTLPKPPATSTTHPHAAAAPSGTVAAPAPVAALPPMKPVGPPVVAPAPPAGEAAFLACVRRRESNDNYRAVSWNGAYRGAYQFARSSWDSTARHAGRNDLVGALADQVAPADQDALAIALYRWQGPAPWGGVCS